VRDLADTPAKPRRRSRGPAIRKERRGCGAWNMAPAAPARVISMAREIADPCAANRN